MKLWKNKLPNKLEKKSLFLKYFNKCTVITLRILQVNNIEQDDESVDVKVTHIINVLKKCYKKNGNNPIGFYRFVLHPTDFTTTVENIFYISFIIRDGLACVGQYSYEFFNNIKRS